MSQEVFGQPLYALHGSPIGYPVRRMISLPNEFSLMGLILDQTPYLNNDFFCLQVGKGLLIIHPESGCYLKDGTQCACLGNFQCPGPGTLIKVGVTDPYTIKVSTLPVNFAVGEGFYEG